MIPYSRQKISNKDIHSVSKVLNSKILARGPQIEIFEKKISKIVKSKFGLAVNSATSGLHLACLSLDLKKNDLVWTVPNSFIASANCATIAGGKNNLASGVISTIGGGINISSSGNLNVEIC